MTDLTADELIESAKRDYLQAALGGDESLKQAGFEKLTRAGASAVGPRRPDENPGPTTETPEALSSSGGRSRTLRGFRDRLRLSGRGGGSPSRS